MKRYTGQKALYEAISRSRGNKTKPRSILERLRPEPPKLDAPPSGELPPQVEPERAPEQPEEPVVQTPVEPQVVETSPEQAVECEPQTDAGSAVPLQEPLAELTSEPVERVEPVVRSRPIERIGHSAPPSPVQPWLRPRPVQINEGRIEVSVPYYVGIVAGLAALVVVLAAFRLGQASGSRRANSAGGQAQGAATSPPVPSGSQQETPGTTPAASDAVAPGAARQNVAPIAPQGDNWIVLVQHDKREDLAPVVQHFAQHGIELFILPLEQAPALFAEYGLNASRLPRGSGYLLVTAQAFNNPNDPTTDGYAMVQKIKEVGAKYKAQPGYASFAPRNFSDAYGMKIR